MTTQTEAMKLALEALEDIKDDCSGCEFEWSNDYPLQAKAHAAIKEALAQPERTWKGQIDNDAFFKSVESQPEQEPVAWLDEYGNAFPLAAKQYSVVGKHWKPLYTIPPQRKCENCGEFGTCCLKTLAHDAQNKENT